jgi:hypothetical protein
LVEFNARIVGSMRVVESIDGPGFVGEVGEASGPSISLVRAGSELAERATHFWSFLRRKPGRADSSSTAK